VSSSDASAPPARKYSVRVYGLPKEFVSDVSRLTSRRTLASLCGVWLGIFALVFFATRLLPHSWFWYVYLPVGIVIAGRQGALLQIVHEAAHQLVSGDKRTNDFVGNWLAALPVGLTLPGYQAGHMQHHAYTGTADDLPNDLEKHAFTDLKDKNLHLSLIRDAVGISALRSFLGHSTRHKHPSGQPAPAARSMANLSRLAKMGVVQLIILAVIFRLRPIDYLLLWIVPLVTFNMLLMRVRGIAEHGLPGQRNIPIETADQGNLHTRSMVPAKGSLSAYLVSGVETVLIGSLSCNFHHEHHLLPNVPYYNLRKIHERIREQASRIQPDIYVSGYFAAFLKGRRQA
jgi:fatty acid desaturase